jgi:hypothetical protein
MPQLNGVLLDNIITIIFVFLIINDIIGLLDQLDDELVSYNNYNLITL